MSKFISKLSPKWRCFELSLASLLILTSISNTEAKPDLTKVSHQTKQNISFLVKNSNTLLNKKTPKDGIYLYGQSPQVDQIGQEYMVFEVRQGKVIGAFFLPQSEFSCFQGSLVDGKLDVIIANDSNSEPYSDPIADTQSSQVAAAGNTQIRDQQMSSSYSVALQNYHKISSLSNNDKRILTSCKKNYQ